MDPRTRLWNNVQLNAQAIRDWYPKEGHLVIKVLMAGEPTQRRSAIHFFRARPFFNICSLQPRRETPFCLTSSQTNEMGSMLRSSTTSSETHTWSGNQPLSLSSGELPFFLPPSPLSFCSLSHSLTHSSKDNQLRASLWLPNLLQHQRCQQHLRNLQKAIQPTQNGVQP